MTTVQEHLSATVIAAHLSCNVAVIGGGELTVRCGGTTAVQTYGYGGGYLRVGFAKLAKRAANTNTPVNVPAV